MSTVGIRELRDKLSSYIDQVKEGGRVTVTDRGKVVAVISPPVEYGEIRDLSDMVREEAASWSGGKPTGSPRPAKIKGKPVGETVLEERR